MERADKFPLGYEYFFSETVKVISFKVCLFKPDHCLDLRLIYFATARCQGRPHQCDQTLELNVAQKGAKAVFMKNRGFKIEQKVT